METKLNDFLLLEYTQGRVDTFILSEKEIIKEIKENCKDFRFSHTPIWRNVNDMMDDYYLINPKLHTRNTIITQNYYQFLIDNSPYWDNIPKRHQSIIGMYGGYDDFYGGARFRMIPYDGANIGIVKDSRDLWDGFKHLTAQTGLKITTINELILVLCEHFGIPPVDNTNYRQFLNDMKVLENKILTEFDSIKYKPFYVVNYKKILDKLRIQLSKGRSFAQVINEYTKPQDNQIRPISYNELITLDPKNINMNDGKEVWTDSKCLLIFIDQIKNIKKSF